MASIKKVFKDTWIARRYAAIEGKENRGYSGTPGPATKTNMETENRHYLRRNTRATQSIRDVVGTFRQKLKRSTRQRKRLENGMNSPVTPGVKKGISKKTPTRRGGYREVKMYSPFTIDTPKNQTPLGRRARYKWFDVETPTRLRKEVEDLTANMQALVSLTPNTLMTRAASRRSLQAANSTATNGSMKTPKSNKKVKVTVRRSIQTEI